MTGGATVTITGENLGTTGAATVHFGNTLATILSDTGNQIVAVSPRGLTGAVEVTVTVQSGPSATSAADKFTYVAAPTVAHIAPKSGPATGGTLVTITGTNLGALGTASVKFGSTAALVVSDTGTQIVAKAPARSAGKVNVTVATAGGASVVSATDQFTYVAVTPVKGIASLPGAVKGGVKAIITGTNQANPINVFFGRTAATVSVSPGVTDAAILSIVEELGSNRKPTPRLLAIHSAGGLSGRNVFCCFIAVSSPPSNAMRNFFAGPGLK